MIVFAELLAGRLKVDDQRNVMTVFVPVVIVQLDSQMAGTIRNAVNNHHCFKPIVKGKTAIIWFTRRQTTFFITAGK